MSFFADDYSFAGIAAITNPPRCSFSCNLLRLLLFFFVATILINSQLIDGADSHLQHNHHQHHHHHKQQIKYNGYKLFRLQLPANEKRLEEVLNLLSDLEADGSRFNANGDRMPLLDLWTDRPSRANPRMEILVAPEFSATFLEILAKKGAHRVETISENIQKDIDREKRAMIEQKRRRRRRRRRERSVAIDATAAGNAASLDLNTYNSYQKISLYLRRIADDHPDIVQLLNFTKTSEGRDLLGVKIGKRFARKGQIEAATDNDDGLVMTTTGKRPLIFLDAGVHAREWIAPAAALYLIDKFITALSCGRRAMNHTMAAAAAATPDPHLTVLLEQIDIAIVPVANPDGYEYSMSKDRLWRKTRSRNESMHRWCVGADGNRNWGYKWAETGASRSPCSNIFPGWAPFSEPEVRAIRDYLSKQIGQLSAYISLHSYGQLILSPWGYTTEKPDNFEEQQKLAEIAVEAIRDFTGTEYSFGSIADLLYPASGTSIDYWQHKGVPYIYGVELRPEDVETELHGFAIPPEQIEPTGREMLVLIKKIAEYLLLKRRIFTSSSGVDGSRQENEVAAAAAA